MLPGISKIFERVVDKIAKGGGLIKDKVEDIPSAFLVKVNNTRKKDKETYKQLVKETKKGKGKSENDDDEPDADFEGKMDELGEYVDEIGSKGRNREKIKTKGSAARKGSKKKAIAGR
jgi:hypothetical protein